jgi:hypothetical protein
VDNKPPTPGEILIMVAGTVTLIASFLDFASKSNSWDSFLFPIATLITVYGVLMAAQIAIAKFANVNMRDRVGSFTWEQVHLLLSVFALLMSIGWIVSGIPQKGVGLWLLLLASIGLVVGAVMLQRERNTGAIR